MCVSTTLGSARCMSPLSAPHLVAAQRLVPLGLPPFLAGVPVGALQEHLRQRPPQPGHARRQHHAAGTRWVGDTRER